MARAARKRRAASSNGKGVQYITPFDAALPVTIVDVVTGVNLNTIKRQKKYLQRLVDRNGVTDRQAVMLVGRGGYSSYWLTVFGGEPFLLMPAVDRENRYGQHDSILRVAEGFIGSKQVRTLIEFEIALLEKLRSDDKETRRLARQIINERKV